MFCKSETARKNDDNGLCVTQCVLCVLFVFRELPVIKIVCMRSSLRQRYHGHVKGMYNLFQPMVPDLWDNLYPVIFLVVTPYSGVPTGVGAGLGI